MQQVFTKQGKCQVISEHTVQWHVIESVMKPVWKYERLGNQVFLLAPLTGRRAQSWVSCSRVPRVSCEEGWGNKTKGQYPGK